MKKLILFMLFSLSSFHAIARDAIVLKLKDCRFLKGFILSVEENINFIDTSGRIISVSEDEISLILTYGISESPFKKNIQLVPEFNNYLKSISLRAEDKKIIGFPFQYIEDLIFIMGIDGKMYVLSLNEIISIDDFDNKSELKIGNNKNYFFDFQDYQSGCSSSKEVGRVPLRPVRVLGDKIKVSEFIENYKKGYRKFIDLQERTLFYSKPFLYPRRNRMGILSVKSKKTPLPFYYQWTTGEDFHFQSVNRFGGMISPYLPTFEAGSVFSTEFKSHFFHGYFEGNLLGLSSGNIPQDFKTTKPKETTYVTNYNYMAFMGADWKKLSFSYGGGYLTPFFQYKKIEKRELAANKLASALMIRYSHDLFNLKAITYILEDASSGNFKMTDQVNIDSATVSAINSYKVKGSFYRLGGEVFFPDSISLGADLLFGNINYKEFTSGGSNTIDVKSNEYLIYLKKQFGHFITLKAVMKANNTKLDGVISSTTLTDEVTSTYYGGVFELLF